MEKYIKYIKNFKNNWDKLAKLPKLSVEDIAKVNEPEQMYLYAYYNYIKELRKYNSDCLSDSLINFVKSCTADIKSFFSL